MPIDFPNTPTLGDDYTIGTTTWTYDGAKWVLKTYNSLHAVPVGAMLDWAPSSNIPNGWMLADGAAISRTQYADLFAEIGTTYGTGDGSTTFNIPNILASPGSPVTIIKATTGGAVEPSSISHAVEHVRGGSDVVDGDRVQLDWVPSNYTRDSSPSEAGATTDLTAHLKGLDTLAGQGHIVCTSSTRPTGIGEGTMIYETDTNKVFVYSGSGWVEVSDLDNIGALATNAYNSFKNSSMTTVTAATFSTSSTSFVDATGVSVSITPTSTASKVLVIASVSWGPDTAGNAKYAWKIVGGNTANYTGVAAGSRKGTMAGLEPHGDTNVPVTNTYVVLDSPNTTSATTYKVQVAALGGSTVYLNRSFADTNAGTVSRASSNITAIELLG